MTPQEIAALTALVAMIKEIGSLPLFSIVLLSQVGPWMGMLVITYVQGRRHAAAVRMYEDNVILAKSNMDMAEGFRDIVVLATQTMTQVKSGVEANLFCPLMRKNPKVEREVGGC